MDSDRVSDAEPAGDAAAVAVASPVNADAQKVQKSTPDPAAKLQEVRPIVLPSCRVDRDPLLLQSISERFEEMTMPSLLVYPRATFSDRR